MLNVNRPLDKIGWNRFARVMLPVNLYGFGVAAAASAVIALHVALICLRDRRTRWFRLWISFWIAGAIAPTVITPYHKTYVESALLVAALAVVGIGNFLAFLFGAVPLLVTAAAVYAVLTGILKRWGNRDQPI